MRLATVRTPGGTAAVRVDDDGVVELGAADLGAFLAVTRVEGVGELRNTLVRSV